MAVQLKELMPVNELGLFEIRLESIGGLGANIAGKMLAEAGVLHLGLNGSNFSSYGSEKKGSPVKSFIRFSLPNVRIRASSPIEQPHVIGVFHEALFKTQNCISGLRPEGILLVNTTKSPDEIRALTGLKSGTIVCVDALTIAVEEKTRVNTAMLGALSRVCPFLDPQAVKDVIRETFEKKYPHTVAGNMRTFDRGYNDVVLKTYSADESAAPEAYVRPKPQLGYETQPLGGVIFNPGNSILKDLSSSRAGFLPMLNREKCIHCAACDQVCPDFCFVWKEDEDKKGRTFQFLQGIDYQYCKGCLKCVQVCPTNALTAERETDSLANAHAVKHQWALLAH